MNKIPFNVLKTYPIFVKNVSTPYPYSYPQNDMESPAHEKTIQRYFVKLLQIDEPSYLYLKSEQAAYADEGILSDPVKIYSNVKNGLGIVGTFLPYIETFDAPIVLDGPIYTMFTPASAR